MWERGGARVDGEWTRVEEKQGSRREKERWTGEALGRPGEATGKKGRW